jgi:ferredoxin
MPFVVTEPCFDCKYTDCVSACPVEAFYQDEYMLYIHPDVCIDCGCCVPECPVEAIYDEPLVPAPWRHYVQLNADRARACVSGVTENITRPQEPKLGPRCGKK